MVNALLLLFTVRLLIMLPTNVRDGDLDRILAKMDEVFGLLLIML